MARRSQLRRWIYLVVLLGAAAPAAAQPAPRPSPRPPVVPEPTPAAEPDAPGATAPADTDHKLAEQQQRIDALSAALADAQREQQALHASDQALRAAIDAEHQARIERDASARAAPAVPAVRSAWALLTLSGLAQLDAVIRQSSEDELRQSGDVLNQDRFLLRRGRIRATAEYGDVSGLLEVDLNTVNGSQLRVSTAEASYRIAPWLAATLGIPKIPFGFEVDQSDRVRLFLERSTVVRALFPGEYDVGAKLAGRWQFLRYALAVQNGEPAGERGFALRDPNQDKDITGRAGVETSVGRVGIAFGFSVLTGRGFHAGTPATKDVLVWKDMNEDGVVGPGEIQVTQGQSATPSSSYDRFGVGADAQLTLDLGAPGRLTLYGELMVANNLDRAIVLPDPVVLDRDLRELGYYAAAVYEPAAWSALGVRFDRYDPDADASESRVGAQVPADATLSTLAITGALRQGHGRLILEYDHNTNHSGRTAGGVPTSLADDAVMLRAEVQL